MGCFSKVEVTVIYQNLLHPFKKDVATKSENVWTSGASKATKNRQEFLVEIMILHQPVKYGLFCGSRHGEFTRSWSWKCLFASKRNPGLKMIRSVKYSSKLRLQTVSSLKKSFQNLFYDMSLFVVAQTNFKKNLEGRKGNRTNQRRFGTLRGPQRCELFIFFHCWSIRSNSLHPLRELLFLSQSSWSKIMGFSRASKKKTRRFFVQTTQNYIQQSEKAFSPILCHKLTWPLYFCKQIDKRNPIVRF